MILQNEPTNPLKILQRLPLDPPDAADPAPRKKMILQNEPTNPLKILVSPLR
jgi:hypothetical protein